MPARVLIIEDNPANLELMTYLLETFGHCALAAHSGEEGIEAARRERPDLIVCDIQLPGIDGYAVAQRLKSEAELSSIPLVAVTAFAMVGDRDKVLAAGFDGYVSKPLEPEPFVPQIEVFLRADQRATRPASAASTAAAAPARPTRGRILVVDDQPVNRSLKRSLFEPVGFVVLTASGMTEALAAARQHPPDLIISDLGMADGSGFEFIRRVKAEPRLKDIPFVFITSTYNSEAVRAQGLALGAARFLFRPLEPQVLLAEIEACLRNQSAR